MDGYCTFDVEYMYIYAWLNCRIILCHLCELQLWDSMD